MKHLDVTKPFSFVMPAEVLQQLAKGHPVFMTATDNTGGAMFLKIEKVDSLPGLDPNEDPTA